MVVQPRLFAMCGAEATAGKDYIIQKYFTEQPIIKSTNRR